jgi:glycosyltransferase involved in cell wall biosynthesis
MERQLLHLAHGLAARGDDVAIACIHPWGIDFAEVMDAGVRILKVGRRHHRTDRLLAVARVARLARARDLVHCTGWDASLWGRIGGVLARRPVLVTEHTPGRETQVSEGSGASRAQLIAWHNRLLDPFTYATVAVAERQVPWLREEGVRADGIVHIPNGVPLAPVRAAARAGGVDRAALGVPDGARVVIHVARFEPQKRQAVTYETVRALRDELGEDVHVLFAGYGYEHKDALEERVRAAGDAAWVHFLGPRDDVAALLALADLAVLPSSAEALPMVVIEAMAVGVPQVATDVGDVAAVLRATGAGLVVDADDLGAFRAACRSVLTDAGVAARLREQALARADEFDAGVMVDRYSRLFDAAIAGAPAATAV